MDDWSCGLCRVVRRLASYLGRSLCLRSLLKFFGFTSYSQFIVLKRVMSFFIYLSKELPDADRITASPTLVKSMYLWISLSMYNPTSWQISAPSLAPIDTSNWKSP